MTLGDVAFSRGPVDRVVYRPTHAELSGPSFKVVGAEFISPGLIE